MGMITPYDHAIDLYAILRNGEKTWADFVQAIEARDAAIRAQVVEQCALIAESERLGENTMLAGTGMWAVHDGACNQVAAAIRNLNQSDQSGKHASEYEADEKAAWIKREADLTRERDEALQSIKDASHMLGNEAFVTLRDLRERAEKAEADAAAMREALERRMLISTDPDHPSEYWCDLCGSTGSRKDQTHSMSCPLSSTAGRDLLARIERMQEAICIADKIMQWGAAKGDWRELPEVKAALADQPGEKGCLDATKP